MELLLHIGTGKTGTTSIQDFLGGHEAELDAQGIYLPRYGQQATPGRCAHHRVACSLKRQYPKHTKPRDTIEGYLAKQREEAPDHSRLTLLSSEFFNGISTKRLCRLRDAARQHYDNVRTIVYLRRQDTYVESSFNQSVRGGDIITFDESIARDHSTRNWEKLFNKWASVFGEENVIVRPFSKGHFANGSLEDDFVASIGADPVRRRPMVNTGSSPSNVSLHNDLVEVKRRINILMDGLRGRPENKRVLQALYAYSDAHPAAPAGSLFTVRRRKEFLRRYDASNGRLFDKVLAGQPNPLCWTDEEVESIPEWRGITEDQFTGCIDFIEEIDPEIGSTIKNAMVGRVWDGSLSERQLATGLDETSASSPTRVPTSRAIPATLEAHPRLKRLARLFGFKG